MAMSPETIAERKAFRKREKELNKLIPIAGRVTVVDRVKELVEVQLNGAVLAGQLQDVNPLLERMGYRPVRITTNMLNPTRYWAIDINTPSYCDPGRESYHSM